MAPPREVTRRSLIDFPYNRDVPSLLPVLASLLFGQTAFDEPLRITRIRFRPAAGQAAKMKGGRFTGSNSSATNDFEEIVRLEQEPKEGEWTEVVAPVEETFRFVKYEGTWNTHGAIAEIEFYAGDRKIPGTPFSTVAEAGQEAKHAFDGDPNTVFRGKEANSQYVGIDLGQASQAAAPVLSVAPGAHPAAIRLRLASPTPGAVVRYVLNEGAPGRTRGTVAEGEIEVKSSAVVIARAFAPGLAPSPLTVAPYRIGAPTGSRAIKTFHIGNSLTDTVVPWMEPMAAAAGRGLEFHRFTIPGAPTDWLWNHPGSGFGDSRYREAFLAQAPIDHIFTQPFAGHGRSIENEAEHSRRFYDAVREHSPNIQPWLYVQWPSRRLDDGWSRGEGAVKDLPGVAPAKDFAGAIRNFMIYGQAVRERINRDFKGKPVRIVPAGPALAKLKAEIEAGRVPGMTDFFGDLFSDDLHLNAKGAYLVSLVHYSCVFRESPLGKVGPLQSGLTPEQASIMAKIAWETVKPTL